jgi:hypothetical protein
MHVVPGDAVLKSGITALAGGAAPTLAANTLDGLYNVVGTVATGGNSLILPAGMPQFSEIFVYNDAANTCDVYPNTGATLCGGVATTGQRGVATKTGAWFIQVGTDGLTWVADNTVAAVS